MAALRFTSYEPDDFWNDRDLASLSPETRAEIFHRRPLAESLDHVASTNPAAGVHRPKEGCVFGGRVYLLVNGGSASSGAEVPALCHFLGLGTLIGEEPNGAYQGVTACILLDLTLPNSGLRTLVPLIAYHNAVLPGLFDGRGAPPHFEVRQTLADALAGKDTVLDFTLALIRARASR